MSRAPSKNTVFCYSLAVHMLGQCTTTTKFKLYHIFEVPKNNVQLSFTSGPADQGVVIAVGFRRYPQSANIQVLRLHSPEDANFAMGSAGSLIVASKPQRSNLAFFCFDCYVAERLRCEAMSDGPHFVCHLVICFDTGFFYDRGL
jgi:hypothetical protein